MEEAAKIDGSRQGGIKARYKGNADYTSFCAGVIKEEKAGMNYGISNRVALRGPNEPAGSV